MAKRFFIPIRNVLQSVLDLDVDEIALEIAKTKEFKTLVIKLNTEGKPTSQLFELGEDSEGRSLESIGGPYAPFTVQQKILKGQPTDRITLKDTGDFYMTFKIIPFKGGFRILADPIKDDTNLFEEWGEDIVGLNEINLQIVIEFYKEKILESVNNVLNAA